MTETTSSHTEAAPPAPAPPESARPESARPAPPHWDSGFPWMLLAALAALTLMRIAFLWITPLNLGGDEAQYWDWSRTLDFGYFSKPPMIAWIIGLTTAVCGDGEACVRVSSPLLHMATSLVLYALAARMFNRTTALWTAITYALLPGISFSSGLVSTDVPLLFFWSLSLLALYALIETGKRSWAVLLGASLGLGLMSKYAMIYFLLGIAILVVFDARVRRRILSVNGLLVFALMLLALSPNLLWNLSHDFYTLSHTASNANWGNSVFRWSNIFDFLGDQLAIFGPILFAVLVVACAAIVYRPGRLRSTPGSMFLLSFSLPALLIIMTESFISRANGNWAATAYPSASVFVVSALLSKNTFRRGRSVLAATNGLHLLFGLALYIVATGFPLIDRLGLENAFKRVRGWPQTMSHITGIYDRIAADGLLFDDRLVYTEFLYYERDRDIASYIWDDNQIPENQYEYTRALSKPTDETLMLVSRSPRPSWILNEFAHADLIEQFVVPLGGKKQRSLSLYRLQGFDGRLQDK